MLYFFAILIIRVTGIIANNLDFVKYKTSFHFSAFARKTGFLRGFRGQPLNFLAIIRSSFKIKL